MKERDGGRQMEAVRHSGSEEEWNADQEEGSSETL